MCRNHLVSPLGPYQVTDLGPCFIRQLHPSGKRVPVFYGFVCCSSTAYECATLPRAPCNRLDSCCMSGEFPQESILVSIPNKQVIVVPSGGKHSSFSVPFQATDFLHMPGQLTKILLWRPNIPMQYPVVAATGRQDIRAPCERPFASSP